MFNFWRDAVLGQGSTLIINLCRRVGDHYSTPDCFKYWPQEPDTTQEFIDEKKIEVTTTSKDKISDLLSIYKLHVELKPKVGKLAFKKADVTMVHFRGFDDCEVPEEPDEISGFTEVTKSLFNHYRE